MMVVGVQEGGKPPCELQVCRELAVPHPCLKEGWGFPISLPSFCLEQGDRDLRPKVSSTR